MLLMVLLCSGQAPRQRMTGSECQECQVEKPCVGEVPNPVDPGASGSHSPPGSPCPPRGQALCSLAERA